MTARVVTRSGSSGRALAWIALAAVIFVVLLLATTFLAAWFTSQLGIADPEREHFALISAIAFAVALLVAVPLIGELLGEGRMTSPAPLVVVGFALAAVSSYVIIADNRSGLTFETDHALPEILVPVAVALLASIDLGRRSATTQPARRAWSWAALSAAVLVLVLVILTANKVIGGAMGMSRLDSPLTFTALAVAAAYAITAALRSLSGERH